MDEREGGPGLKPVVTDILKGMTRQVPARMAVEHGLSLLAETDGVHWCALTLRSDGRDDCVAIHGEPGAERRPVAAEIEQTVADWSPDASDRLVPGIFRLPGSSGADCCRLASALPEASGRTTGHLICEVEQDKADDLTDDIELITWLLASAVEQERLHNRVTLLDRRHNAIIESLPNVVYEQSLDGELLYLSPKVARLTGYRADELIGGRRFEAIIDPEDRDRRRERVEEIRSLTQRATSYQSLVAELSSGQVRTTVEYRLTHRNGRDIVWVADNYVLRMRDPTETLSAALKPTDFVIAGVLIDLRERKRLEIEALQQSRLKTIGELAAGVAHEINNPLTAVLTYGQLLERWLARSALGPDERAKGEEYLGHILEQGKAIYEITRNLTGFVRRGSGEGFQPITAHELVTSSLSIFRYPFKKEHIKLVTDIPVDLPPIRVRARQLRQVILNLVSNARASLNARFPDPGQADPSKKIHIAARRLTPELVRITVTDFGEGIAPENREKIFDAFFSTRKDGTGLGLSIVAEILRDHEGAITAESSPTDGTSFHIDLPVWSANGAIS